LQLAQVRSEPRYAQRGRPRPGAAPTHHEVSITTSCAVDEEQLAQAIGRAASFIVATNVLDGAQLPDEELIAIYKDQHSVEIVCSQMTKTHLLAGWNGPHHVVDLHLAVGDIDAVNQELRALLSLLPGRLREPCLNAGAEGGNRLHEPSKILVALRFRLELVHLTRNRMDLLLHRLTPALILLQRHPLV